ncbi:MAG: hypothetical protein H6742_17645 [Alphaproteobacteria bacterium]|nr:hypothetical protein [Alphaproteobacteria bacterium]
MVILLLALACSSDKAPAGVGDDDTGAAGGCGDTGAVEICNGEDDDCDGQVDEGAVDATAWYPDDDGDGHGDPSRAVDACDPPDGYIAVAGDCDDADPTRNTGAQEICDDADVDEDCDGLADDDDPDAEGGVTWYQDLDGDDHGTGVPQTACDPPDHSAEVDDDCDDTRIDVHPGAVDVCEDDVDQDCDGDDARCVDERLVKIDDDEALLVWHGPSAYEHFGRAAHGGEDIDGDGIPDLVMGNSLAVVDGVDLAGAAYLGLGGRTGRHSVADADLIVEGDGYLGMDVVLLPATDGGAGAFAVSGYQGDDACAVWRFDLPDGAWPSAPLTPDDADAVLEDAGRACFGREVALLSDAGGDGARDLVTASMGPVGGRGAVHRFAGGWPDGVDDADLRVTGSLSAGFFWKLVELSDVDGDGCGELAAVEQNWADDGIVLSVWSACQTGELAAGDVDSRIDLAGVSADVVGGVASLGDADGDGLGDLAIGIPSRAVGTLYGQVFVLHGPLDAAMAIEDVPDAIEGDAEPLSSFGSAVLGPGDLDGDGRGDLLVGDETWSEEVLDVGGVFAWVGDIEGVHLQSSHDRRWVNLDNQGLQGGHMLEPYGARTFLMGAITDSSTFEHAGALFLFEVGDGL